MRVVGLIGALASSLFVAHPPAAATTIIGGMNLTGVIMNSDLIVQGYVMEWHEWYRAGWAVLKVERVLKGTYEEPTISVDWIGVIGTDSIRHVDRAYLLFLRKRPEGGPATSPELPQGPDSARPRSGANYSGNYWPLLRTTDAAKWLVTPYANVEYNFPFGLPDGLEPREAKVYVADLGKIESVQALYLEDIIKLIERLASR